MIQLDVVKLANTRFVKAVRPNPQGSVFLGYLYAELVVQDALGDGLDLRIGMPDVQVRITRSGDPRIDFPSDEKTIRGETRRVERYFTASRDSRNAMTTLVFALPAVAEAVEEALAEDGESENRSRFRRSA